MNVIGRLSREILCISRADSIILNYPNHYAEENRVNLHYYHAGWGGGDGVCHKDINLGDYLSEVICRTLCSQNGIDFEQTVNAKKHLYAIGSILQMGYQDATIWGSGFAFEISWLRGLPHKKRKLDIRCVRGPLTCKTLNNLGFECPKIYGDPGVLMPRIYKPKNMPRMEYAIIPHYSTEKQMRKRYGDETIISMNTNDYRTVIDRICTSDKVISSSLHGIILAEAYGIPAVFYQDRPSRFNYKYEDWYQSTGRFNVKPCESIEECLKKGIIEPDATKIHEMQEKLLEAFPQDLWRMG